MAMPTNRSATELGPHMSYELILKGGRLLDQELRRPAGGEDTADGACDRAHCRSGTCEFPSCLERVGTLLDCLRQRLDGVAGEPSGAVDAVLGDELRSLGDVPLHVRLLDG